jgi:hypothetical protein
VFYVAYFTTRDDSWNGKSLERARHNLIQLQISNLHRRAKKTEKILCHYSACSDRDSNPPLPKYKTRAMLVNKTVWVLILLVETLADFVIKILYTYFVSPLNSICKIETSRMLLPLSCSRLAYNTLARTQYICLACPLKHFFSLSMGLKPIGPWSLFFSFLILYTVGRTALSEDQHVARPLLTHRINAYRHPCLMRDSNPRSQCSSERRQFMPQTAWPLWSTFSSRYLSNLRLYPGNHYQVLNMVIVRSVKSAQELWELHIAYVIKCYCMTSDGDIPLIVS